MPVDAEGSAEEGIYADIILRGKGDNIGITKGNCWRKLLIKNSWN